MLIMVLIHSSLIANHAEQHILCTFGHLYNFFGDVFISFGHFKIQLYVLVFNF
jgi:hypothetical protein